jgi:hypothetical protein
VLKSKVLFSPKKKKIVKLYHIQLGLLFLDVYDNVSDFWSNKKVKISVTSQPSFGPPEAPQFQAYLSHPQCSIRCHFEEKIMPEQANHKFQQHKHQLLSNPISHKTNDFNVLLHFPNFFSSKIYNKNQNSL